MPLLRIELGIASVIQGVYYFFEPINLFGWSIGVGSLLIVSGLSILIGFLTPIGAVLILASSLISILFAFPIFTGPFSSTVTSPFFLSAALSLLGPGAYSIDAILYGRREITIPKV